MRFWIAILAWIASAAQAAEFHAPDEAVLAGVSKHGAGKDRYDFNEHHLILGSAGKVTGLPIVGDARWEIGAIPRDSYGCPGIYGAIEKSVASWKLTNILIIRPGIALYAGNKCVALSDDGTPVRAGFVLPLPVLRIEIGKLAAVEIGYLPQLHKDDISVLFGTFRYRL